MNIQEIRSATGRSPRSCETSLSPFAIQDKMLEEDE